MDKKRNLEPITNSNSLLDDLDPCNQFEFPVLDNIQAMLEEYDTNNFQYEMSGNSSVDFSSYSDFGSAMSCSGSEIENFDMDMTLVERSSIQQSKLNLESNISKCEVQKRKATTNRGTVLSMETIQPYLKGTLRDAATLLGVSPSKLKRACRRLGIQNWQEERDKAGYPKQKRSSCSRNSGVHHFTDKPSSSGQERTFIVKAKYNEDMIRFRFPVSGSFNALQEEMTKRLDIKMGSVKIKYLDDEQDLVLIACESDLQDCIAAHISVGRVKLFIDDNPQITADSTS